MALFLDEMDPLDIFVFGSNLAGKHGAGSAREAVKYWGAIYGCGVGPQGLSYAIPTKDEHFHVLSVDTIRPYVVDFLAYAAKHPYLNFRVVAIGCGLAGYTPAEIAPLFVNATPNVHLPKEFVDVLNEVDTEPQM